MNIIITIIIIIIIIIIIVIIIIIIIIIITISIIMKPCQRYNGFIFIPMLKKWRYHHLDIRPGAHFTNDFSIVIKIRWEIVYVAIYFLAITSLQRFAHATTAQLLCHAKNIVTITLLEFRWEQN